MHLTCMIIDQQLGNNIIGRVFLGIVNGIMQPAAFFALLGTFDYQVAYIDHVAQLTKFL
jgi:hypothetical protein